MAELYNVSYDIETLEKLYIKRNESDDLLGALSVLKRMRDLEPSDYSLCVDFARIYFKFGEYEQAAEEWFKYLGECSEKEQAMAYSGLGAVYFKSGNKRMAGYYFDKQIRLAPTTVYEYADVFTEFLAEMTDISSHYYIAYPYDKADFTNLFQECEELFNDDEYEAVIDKLSAIPKDSEFYSEALSKIALCKYFIDDTEGALKDLDKAVNNSPKCVLVICNAISINNKLGHPKKVKKYREILESIKEMTDEELQKTILVYCELGEHEIAETRAEKYLKYNPYDSNVLLILGMIKYNLKKYDEAEELFTKCYQITSSWTSKYYIKMCRRVKSGEFEPEYVEYSFDIPDFERNRIVSAVGAFMQKGYELYDCDEEDAILYLADYAFESHSFRLQSSFVTAITSIGTDKSRKYLASLLIKSHIYDQIKSGILGFLTADGFNGTYPAQFGNVFVKINFEKTEFKGDGSEVMNEAYALCFAKLAPIEQDLSKLRNTALEMFYGGKVNFAEIKDVKALSAVIFELSEIKQIKNRREFAKFFDANLKEVKRIKELFTDTSVTDKPE